MIFRFLLSIICMASLGSCTHSVQEHNQLSKEELAGDWHLLFDGRDPGQWRSYLKDSLEGWVVEDGALKALGLGADLGGDIITRKQYENFELKLDWKIGSAGNSGILFMVVEDTAFRAVYESGPEYQLIDDDGYPGILEEWQKAGANYAMHTVESKILHPVGEWNTARILVNDGHIEHWLNGQKIVEYELWTDDWYARVSAGKWKDYPGYGLSKTGHIALQDHGSFVWFRNIKIREL